MTFTKFFPVALMIAVVAALFVLIAPMLGVSSLWVPFISWPLYFIAGAKPSRLHKEILGLTGGMLAGFVTIFLLGPFASIFGATLALPMAILLVAFVIVILELTDWFELAPAYFFAFAGYFAYVFGGFGGVSATPLNAMPAFWALLMVGLALGYLTAFMRKKILEKGGLFGTAQETVFDKERQ